MNTAGKGRSYSRRADVLAFSSAEAMPSLLTCWWMNLGGAPFGGRSGALSAMVLWWVHDDGASELSSAQVDDAC